MARPVATLVVSAAGDSPISLPGAVEAAEKVNLSFRVGGPLIELNVEEGDKVKKGQLLARIDPRDFQLVVDATKLSPAEPEGGL